MSNQCDLLIVEDDDEFREIVALRFRKRGYEVQEARNGVEALQLRLRAIGIPLPYQFLLSLPYLVTVAALAIAGVVAARMSVRAAGSQTPTLTIS